MFELIFFSSCVRGECVLAERQACHHEMVPYCLKDFGIIVNVDMIGLLLRISIEVTMTGTKIKVWGFRSMVT